jgi:hypothetical protein
MLQCAGFGLHVFETNRAGPDVLLRGLNPPSLPALTPEATSDH